MRKITEIVIHCSGTKPNVDAGADEIRQWHVQGRGWPDIGYHLVIRRSGLIETGRPIEQIGAHVTGRNANSIGLCLVGGLGENGQPTADFTPEQWAALKAKLLELKAAYPEAGILGHRDFPGVTKACPSFDVKTWLVKEGFWIASLLCSQ
jgi:N-acetylmuramoyl-L-alanine amidase